MPDEMDTKDEKNKDDKNDTDGEVEEENEIAIISDLKSKPDRKKEETAGKDAFIKLKGRIIGEEEDHVKHAISKLKRKRKIKKDEDNAKNAISNLKRSAVGKENSVGVRTFIISKQGIRPFIKVYTHSEITHTYQRVNNIQSTHFHAIIVNL